MGQGYSLNTLPAGPSAIETTELADLTFEKPLGGARFLRTVRARHQHGIVVVKVCAKNGPNVSFKHYAKELKAERQALKGVPNVLPYQKIRETSTIGVLVRQYIHSSLYDRVSIRPFLEIIEKKWIAFQLLCAVRDCHARGRYHGDIKSENVLVTSWGWVYLTDFAAVLKPVYLPEDNPADFSFYYDTSARRTCYVAPERFLAPGQKPDFDGIVEWSMDIFSLGCVIAELFTEVPTFTLSQLFRYRKGEYDPTITLLNKVEDDHVRSLISSMIRLNPEARWHAQDYLDEYKGKAFPLYFYQHLHTLMQEVTDPTFGRGTVSASETNNGESDQRIDRVYNDFEMLSVSLGYEGSTEPSVTHTRGRGLFPLQVDIPNNRHTANTALVPKGDNGTFILLNVVTASLRSVARASSKILACELLLAFSERLPDEAKLDRVLPYIMPLLDDTDEMVLVAALRTTTQVLALVSVTSPANSFLFTQYIFPRLQLFVRTRNFRDNAIVRATYAACLASLAETASRFLDIMQALRADGSLPVTSKGIDEELDGYAAHHDAYDVTRAEVLDQLEGQTKVFLTDNDTAVRRAFLSSVSTLCVVFGESRSSDVILSHLNTYLNDPDWQLKCAFFKTIVGVAVYVGGASLEEFILPLMLQALSDPQEFVVEQALRSLASMAEMGLMQREKTWELIDIAARFEMHPNMWIKEAATHFVSAATTYLSLADLRVLVVPLIKPYLKVPASTLTEAEILDALKKPLPRAVLDLALQWAGQVDRSVFWKQAKELKQLSYRAFSQMPPASSVADLGPKSLGKIPKTDEDEQWLGRLRNAGLRSEDEIKLLAFREYLSRTAQRGTRSDSTSTDDLYEQIVSLTRIGVTPQTVIFETSLDVYDQRKEAQAKTNHRIEDALQEAAASEAEDEALHGAAHVTDTSNIDRGKNSNTITPKLPELRRQTSESGQSLSSSPSSAVGLLGKARDRSSQHRSSASRLLSGADMQNKSIPDVATNGAVASGKLNAPSLGNRRTPLTSQSNQARKGSTRPIVPIRVGHNYAGNDPTILKLLDTVYVDNFPMDAAEFGPIIQSLQPGPIPSSNNPSPTTAWRPQGQLVAVLGEHSDRVTRIIVAPDHSFFVTGSVDGFVKVWDTSRLERNITHRARYSQSLGHGVKVTSICFVESTHTFVCTGSDGSVHFFKVSVSESENGPQFASRMQLLRTWQIPASTTAGEHAVWSDHFRADSGSMLMLATNLGRILAVDLRSMSIAYEFRNPAQHGTPICFCVGRRHDWLLVGTSHGVLDLWDLRFRLRLRSWAFPRAAPISRLQLYPSRKTARRNRVCVSGGTGRGEVTVWDIDKVICHEILRPSHYHTKDRLNARDYELRNLEDDRSESLLHRVAGSNVTDSIATETATTLTTSMFFGVYQQSEDTDAQHPFAVTGGPDNKVRFWDCDRLEGCRLVSGGVLDEKPTYTYSNLTLDTRVIVEKMPDNAQPVANALESSKVAPSNSSKRPAPANTTTSRPPRYEAIRLSAQHLLEGHLDTITDVAVLERPFGMVLSADRSGQIFVHQ